MKFVVTGQSRETGARMTMEFEAESKAAAERKATQGGMSVHRVQDVTDGYPATAAGPRGGSRRRGGGGGLGALVALVLVAAAVYYFWPQIRGMLPF